MSNFSRHVALAVSRSETIWPPRFIQAARRNGMTVIAYTVNEDTMRRLIRGVDGIETDDPELAVRVRP
jgi:glycerophosphoryl diester phosphodiesterase